MMEETLSARQARAKIRAARSAALYHLEEFLKRLKAE
jgi:hypothetical protein